MAFSGETSLDEGKNFFSGKSHADSRKTLDDLAAIAREAVAARVIWREIG